MQAIADPDLTIEQFEACDVDPERFGHEHHVYMGWLYVREFGASTALARFDAAIRRLVAHLGAEDKYHATITWFFLILIADRIKDGQSWQQFKHCNADIVVGSKPILARHYSDELLLSNRARQRFVLPNKLSEA